MKLIFLMLLPITATAGIISGPMTAPKSTKPTFAQRQAIESTRVSQFVNQGFNHMIKSINDLNREIWKNPQGLTPQQVMTALGINAASLVSAMATITASANAIYPGVITAVSPHTLTSNSDGTVTVGP
jgi:hypothetical protein